MSLRGTLGPIDPRTTRPVDFPFRVAGAPVVSATITCRVVGGTDPDPAQRIIGAYHVLPSATPGVASGTVRQLVGNMIAGVVYELQCVAVLLDGSAPSIRWLLPCSVPPEA